jgi:hypothetical protein
MISHRFKLDDTVIATGIGVAPGPYRITRLLPASDQTGVPNYRVADVANNQERALAETAMRTWSETGGPFDRTKMRSSR